MLALSGHTALAEHSKFSLMFETGYNKSELDCLSDKNTVESGMLLFQKQNKHSLIHEFKVTHELDRRVSGTGDVFAGGGVHTYSACKITINGISSQSIGLIEMSASQRYSRRRSIDENDHCTELSASLAENPNEIYGRIVRESKKSCRYISTIIYKNL